MKQIGSQTNEFTLTQHALINPVLYTLGIDISNRLNTVVHLGNTLF